MQGAAKRRLILLCIGIVILLSAFLCAGCGEQHAVKREVEKERLKSFVREKDRTELLNMTGRTWERVFVTKNSLYYEYRNSDSGYEYVLVQMDRKGKQIANYPMKDCSNFWVRDAYLCYTQKLREEDKEVIFFVPIKQENGTEKINWNKKRKIAEEEDLTLETFAWESSIYYISDTLYRYDIHSEKTEKLIDENKFDGEVFQQNEGLVCLQEGKIYINSAWSEEKEPLYSLELDSGRVEEIGFDKMDVDAIDSLFVAEGNRIFTCIRNEDGDVNEYLCYDSKAKRKIESLDNGRIRNFLQKNGLWKKEMDFYFRKGFCFDHKLYLVLDLYWWEMQKAQQGAKKGQSVEMSNSTQILVSCSWDNIRELTYEKEISAYLEERQDYVQQCEEREGQDVGVSYEYNIDGGAQFWTLCGGELMISYSKTRDAKNYVDEVGLIGYDLKTDEVREIPENDLLYQIFTKG